MSIYYAFIILLFCFSFLDILCVSRKKTVYILLLIFTSLFYGLRSGCDNDYWNYVQMYDEVPMLTDTSITELFFRYSIIQVEYGFLFICSLLKTIGLPYQAIFLFCSFLTIYYTGKTFWRISSFPFISFFIFNTQFFEQPFMQMRFGVAIALFFYASYCLSKGKNGLFLLYILLASLFQIVGIAGLLLFVLNKCNLTLKKVVFSIILAICLLFIPLGDVLFTIVNNLGFSRYLVYFSDENNRLVTVFMLIAVFLPYVYYRKLIVSYEKSYNLILLIAICSILFCPLSKDLPILNRFYIMYSIAYCMIIPSYLFFIKKSVFSYSVFYVFVFFYALRKFSMSLTFMTPYQFG